MPASVRRRPPAEEVRDATFHTRLDWLRAGRIPVDRLNRQGTVVARKSPSLPNVLGKPEFASKTAAVKYWLRHRRYGLTWIENYAQEIVGWFALLTILVVVLLI